MSVVAQPWLISKFIDPVFAVCVGLSAAALRIQREEKEKFPEQNNEFGALYKKGVGMGKSYYARTMKGWEK